MSQYQMQPQRKLGAPAATAIIATGCSYLLTCSGHGYWGLFTAIIGILSGVLGFFWAALPRRRGVLLSILAIILSAIAIVPAMLVILGKLAAHL